MKRIISKGFGSQVIEKNDKLYIRFDEGHFDIKWVEYEITEEEAARAMKSEQDNYKVCLAAQNRNSIPPSTNA